MHIEEIVLGVKGDEGIRAARQYYVDTLGLPLDHAFDHEIAVRAGGSRLVFSAGETAMRYHFAFNIPENQIEGGRAWITQWSPLIPDEHGADIIHFQSWNAHSIYTFDPLGNVIELIARHGLPTTSDAPFSGASLLNISEIGIPSQAVLADAALYSQRAGAAYYQGKSTETFTAVGDEHGLLIIVSTMREWYPFTGVPAHDRPLSVRVTGMHGDPVELMS